MINCAVADDGTGMTSADSRDLPDDADPVTSARQSRIDDWTKHGGGGRGGKISPAILGGSPVVRRSAPPDRGFPVDAPPAGFTTPLTDSAPSGISL